MSGRAGLAVLALLAAVSAQGPSAEALAACARDPARDAEERVAALSALQDRGALDVATVLAALTDADGSVAGAAAAIVRHEWAVLPPDLFAGLDAHPAAAAALLRELSVAPRPAAAAWAGRLAARADAPADLRCLARAASGVLPTAADGAVLLAAIADRDDGEDGARALVDFLPPAVADSLVGRMHALLAEGQVAAARLGPVLDRLSPDGQERLLGLAVSLPGDAGDELFQYLAMHDVPAFAARSRAALDGQIPLEPAWLLRASRWLDTAPRRERLLAALGDETVVPLLRRRAFEALVEARVFAPAVLAFAVAPGPDAGDRIRRLLDVAVAELPADLLAGWLDAERDEELGAEVLAALGRRPALDGPLEERVLALAANGPRPAALGVTAALLVVARGSEAAVGRVWPQLRGGRHFGEAVETLGRRAGPFAHERLLAELAAPAAEGSDEVVRAVELDAVRVALCGLGDRLQIEALVAHAPARDAAFVRRCAAAARPLTVAQAMALLDAAAAAKDDELAAELVLWAGTVADAAVTERLVAAWRAGGGDERQDAALRALVAGPARPRLLAELLEGLAAGPLDESHVALAFELLATCGGPPAGVDLELCVALALRQPFADRDGEVDRARRWPDGRHGFPLVSAVAQRLRGADPETVARAFAAAATAPAAGAVSRQRLLVLWRTLEAEPELQEAVGRATAELVLDQALGAPLGDGPAHRFLAAEAHDEGDFAAAAAHGARAVAALLRSPAERRTARLFLGDRDPAAGQDPWAALAAMPHLCRAAAARTAGDRATVAAELALAREFAGHDADTLHEIETLSQETAR